MIHVYAGPTLPPQDPVLAGPGIRLQPPARHGDFFNPVVADTDTVVLVDGLYHQAPAVRHKELLALLGRGVRVIGAASIGALRAAELHPYGMEGVGAVFGLYRSGVLTGDDEVAVGQDPVDGRAVTWPLVNLRCVLDLALEAGVLPPGPGVAGRLVEELRGVYYAQRTTGAVRAVCLRAGADRFSSWLEARLEEDPRFGDVKYADAVLAVEVAVTGARVEAGPRPGAGDWDTGYFRRWRAHFAAQTVDGVPLPSGLRLVYQQVFDPGFPVVWRGYLERCSQVPQDGGAGMPLGERMRLLTGRPDGSLVHAVFRVEADVCDERALAVLLARETEADRQAIGRHLGVVEGARLSVPGFCVEAVRDDVAVRMLTAVWECPEDGLGEAAVARGFRGAGNAVEAVKPFVPGFLQDCRRAELVEVAAGSEGPQMGADFYNSCRSEGGVFGG
ncbi:TfuA-like protein [Streptomyces fagopyri]|uniref:TfuA-like protein n=1 Tax=Streptomyces fagopyri TaxID=2662397 RepID=UPI0036ACE8F9